MLYYPVSSLVISIKEGQIESLSGFLQSGTFGYHSDLFKRMGKIGCLSRPGNSISGVSLSAAWKHQIW